MDVGVCSVAQLGLSICDPMDYSPSSFSVHGILQARIMKWVAISHSKFMDNKIHKKQKNPTPTSEESEQDTVHAPCTQHHLFSSVTPLCLILCDPMDCSTPGFPVLHYLPEFAQIHVHWVNDAIQPSHLLSHPSPLALNISQNQGFFLRVSSWHQGQSIGASTSASVLPVNIQDWFHLNHPSGLTPGPVPAAAAAAKSLQSCPTLCDPIDSSPWGSPVPGILQADLSLPSPHIRNQLDLYSGSEQGNMLLVLTLYSRRPNKYLFKFLVGAVLSHFSHVPLFVTLWIDTHYYL